MTSQTSKTLNALRLGVIPDDHIQNFMVGKDLEKEALHEFIASVGNGEGRVGFLKGAYGSGKTFMLKYVTEIALAQNYVVASVPIHSGFGFSKLDGIYENMMNNLMVKANGEKSTSFEAIFENWLKTLRKSYEMPTATRHIYEMINALAEYNGSFANVLMVYIRAKINHDYELSSIAASWIKGDKNLPYQLKRQLNVKGSIDRENALDIFKGFVKLVSLMGYKGLIINFDEAELMMQQRQDIRLKAYSNLRQIMDMAGMGDLPHSGFLFAGTEEFFEDEEKGVKSYGALYQRIGDLIQSASSINNTRQPVIKLRTFKKDHYVALGEKMIHLHEQVYEYDFEAPVAYIVNLAMLEAAKVLNGETMTVRHFLKKFIELLDLMRDNPNLAIFQAMRNRPS